MNFLFQLQGRLEVLNEYVPTGKFDDALHTLTFKYPIRAFFFGDMNLESAPSYRQMKRGSQTTHHATRCNETLS